MKLNTFAVLLAGMLSLLMACSASKLALAQNNWSHPRHQGVVAVNPNRNASNAPAEPVSVGTDAGSSDASCDPCKDITIKIVAVANTQFQDRPLADGSNLEYGLREGATLSVVVSPSNASIGSLRWSTSDDTLGNLQATSMGVAYFTAYMQEGYCTITATVNSEPCLNKKAEIRLHVVKPDGIEMKRSGTLIGHDQNVYSVGIYADIYLTPKSVSFDKLGVAEDVIVPGVNEQHAVATLTGWFLNDQYSAGDKKIHDPAGGKPTQVVFRFAVPNSASEGSKSYSRDKLAIRRPNSPYTPGGTFTWKIPWFYRAWQGDTPENSANQAGNPWMKIKDLWQVFTMTAAGDAKVTKAGAEGNATISSSNVPFNWGIE